MWCRGQGAFRVPHTRGIYYSSYIFLKISSFPFKNQKVQKGENNVLLILMNLKQPPNKTGK